MSIEERKERERDERRELILNAASEIVAAEGIDNLSVRKIAARIEYSPAIIYHYFKDMNDITAHIMRRGYRKIMNALSMEEAPQATPEQQLKELTRRYIHAALQMPDEYKNVQLSSKPGILEYTSSLFEGAASRKPALGILFNCLKEIYPDRSLSDSELELTAQVIAASTFGLITRLIMEKDIIPLEQRNRLIDHYIEMVVDGMVLGKPLNKNRKGEEK